jgi:multimeric flavodoxin WrbA
MSDQSFSHLNALFINGTLKKSPSTSNTRGLMDISINIMKREGVNVETIRLVDHEVPHGMQPDMTEDGYDKDEWPEIFKKIMKADILVVGTPIWMGTVSSVTKKLIERIDSKSSELNDKGQSIYYGRVAGCIITGNEDGAKQCSSTILYALQHVGFTIPPQADTAWLGKVGPGPSYLDEESDAENHEFTNQNTTIMTYNLLHLSSILKSANGYPRKGNDREAWEDGERWAFTKPQLTT